MSYFTGNAQLKTAILFAVTLDFTTSSGSGSVHEGSRFLVCRSHDSGFSIVMAPLTRLKISYRPSRWYPVWSTSHDQFAHGIQDFPAYPHRVFTLSQLCQNYLLLCVLNGKWSESATASNAWIHSV